MFDFGRENSDRRLVLDPNTGEVQSAYGW
jgi:hypothetical protein